MIITTASIIQDRMIDNYLGVVAGVSVTPVSVTELALFPASDYQSYFIKEKNVAIEKLRADAESLGADAIVAVNITFETVDERRNSWLAIATGTAVRLCDLLPEISSSLR